MYRTLLGQATRCFGCPSSRGKSRMAMAAKIGAVLEAKAKPSGSVLFLHGLGDQGAGWTEPLGMIQPNHVRIVCPNAPSMPVTLNGGMIMPAWYDLFEFGSIEKQDAEGIRASGKKLSEWIDAECSALKIESRRIVIGGFSQGGAVSLNTLLSYQKPLAGAIILSSYLPLHETYLRNRDSIARVNQNTPILICHGRLDDVIPFTFGQASVQFLQQLGFTNIRFRAYDDLFHNASMPELNDVRSFLAEVLPADSKQE